MTKPSIHAYSDVIPVMEAAITHGGLKVEFPTFGAAVNFRQRCYRYRNLRQELDAERYNSIPGIPAPAPFADLVLHLVHKASGEYVRVAEKGAVIEKGAPHWVLFEFRAPPLSVTTLDGEPVELAPAGAEFTPEPLDLDFE